MQGQQDHQKHQLTVKHEVLGEKEFPFLGNHGIVVKSWRNGNKVRYEPLGLLVKTFQSRQDAQNHAEKEQLPMERCGIAEGHEITSYTVPSPDMLSTEGLGKVSVSNVSRGQKRFHLFVQLKKQEEDSFRELFNRHAQKGR